MDPSALPEQHSLESARRARRAILLASALSAHAQPQQPQLLPSPGGSRIGTSPPMGVMQLSADGGLSLPTQYGCMLRHVIATPNAAAASAAASAAATKPHKLRLVPLVPLERHPGPKQGLSLRGPVREALDRERELRRGDTYARLAAQLADLESTLVAGESVAEEADTVKTIEQLQATIEQLRAAPLPVEIGFSGATAGLATEALATEALATEADGRTVVQKVAPRLVSMSSAS